MKKQLLTYAAVVFVALSQVSAVCVLNEQGEWVDEDTGGPCPNAIPIAAPFLTITPDARSGSLGDAGVALSADANAMHRNVARIAFGEEKTQISGTYTPWLTKLSLDDIYMAYLSAYHKLDDNQGLGFAFRYFSLGNIDYVGNSPTDFRGSDRPNEFEIAAGYSRKLSENLSIGASGKFIYSDLAADQTIDGFDIKAGTAVAVDLGLYYKTQLNNINQDDLAIGFSMTNLGSKMSYTEQDANTEYLPANLSLGAAYTMHLDDFNDLTFTLEFNKLLVPSPQFDDPETPQNEADEDNNGIADYKEKDFFSSVFGSFGDAPNGFSEELKEINISAGVEYWYNKQFAIRAGYFYENPDKGGRQYITTGLGIKYNLLTINMSYLISTQSSGLQATNPLDKTLRFSVMVNLGGEEGQL